MINPYENVTLSAEAMKKIMPYQQRELTGAEYDQVRVQIELLGACDDSDYSLHVISERYNIGDQLFELLFTIEGKEIGLYELIEIDWDAIYAKRDEKEND
jgi:hypothetical protein